MIREVDLVSYLPPYLTEFKETVAALEAENPEYRLIWEETDKVLKNEFIDTADEYGISRFENMLKIFPNPDETLEVRRTKVKVQWMNSALYTKRGIESLLLSICGEDGYKLNVSADEYFVDAQVALATKSQRDSVSELFERILPCNMNFTVEQLFNLWGDMRVYKWGSLTKMTWKTMREEICSKWQNIPQT